MRRVDRERESKREREQASGSESETASGTTDSVFWSTEGGQWRLFVGYYQTNAGLLVSENVICMEDAAAGAPAVAPIHRSFERSICEGSVCIRSSASRQELACTVVVGHAVVSPVSICSLLARVITAQDGSEHHVDLPRRASLHA
jgi:hypothetical protein